MARWKVGLAATTTARDANPALHNFTEMRDNYEL
jgi:hypothetical protein